MQRAAVLLLLAAALVPAGAAAPGPTQTAIFYYPWYGTPARDGAFHHWDQRGSRPPRTIASAYYPARGAYSSSDPRVVRAHMREIAAAGVDAVVVSWWGRGSNEDRRLQSVVHAARAAELRVDAHVEPYGGRTPSSVVGDAGYLRSLGVRDLYVYDPAASPTAEWRAALAALDGIRVFAQTALPGFAAAAGFDGLYTYDVLVWGADDFARICAQARRNELLCLPSVGPGFDARRATGDVRVKRRRAGLTYDAMWRAAIRAGADAVTITSYNEWHEGTQIEPARERRGYADYDGAWGKRGRTAERAYLARTAYWTARLRTRSRP
jgi:glycoprotein endo-alpha-1,2-mannosidase